MSIQRINPDDIENFTIETNPLRTYSSSSSGVTGSVYLFARRSLIQKDPYSNDRFTVGPFTDTNLESLRLNILRTTTSNINSKIDSYMSGVQELQTSGRQYQKLEIKRFTPPYFTNKDPFNGNNPNTATVQEISTSNVKDIAVNKLLPYYKTVDPNSHFAVSNFHSLNFFTSSNTPDEAVLLYPNPNKTDFYGATYSNPDNLSLYGFSGSFTFDFWVKPTNIGITYKAGTIMHLTGAYCISLHSGSSRDLNGNIDAFKVVLQLTKSANISPSLITSGDYIYSSSNNALKRNEWNHVSIRWGGPSYNNGTGSFVINDKIDNQFVLTNSLLIGDYSYAKPYALCVGNYYNGSNLYSDELKWFFTSFASNFTGLYILVNAVMTEPVTYQFTHPLNAELQELKIYNRYLNINEIKALSKNGPSYPSNGLIFYVPPYFTYESPKRRIESSPSSIPSYSLKESTTTMFNVSMSYGINGLYTNLENYTREFVNGLYPRLINLSSSFPQISDTEPKKANQILYSTGSVQKRLYTVLPSDNGNYFPNFDYLNSLSQSMFVNDNNANVKGFVTLRNQINNVQDTINNRNNINNYGISPEYPVITSDRLSVRLRNGIKSSVLDRTRDNSSNQVVIFDISNMFYGKQIKPGTFTIVDTNMSGSDGMQKITIKDDGLGSLYRADSNGTHAKWATIGNVFYNEGIVLIKHPQLSFFGSNEFEMSFQGVQDIHTLTINTFARPLQQVSSSNTSFTSQSIDNLANNTDERYVYITGINLHDDNLNVIARTNIAQPIVKYSSDKILFKFKMDF